ncbi:hypothetical protein D7X33_21850, partial [Butyricicoccus sp. 1XD8-22]
LKEITLNILMELVPFENRDVEMQVWLEYISYKIRKKEVGEDNVYVAVVQLLTKLNEEGALKEDILLKEEIVHLHALIDGLALHILMGVVPIGEERVRYLIQRELDRLFK